MEFVVQPEEIHIELPREAGSDLAMAWYSLGGFSRAFDTGRAAKDFVDAGATPAVAEALVELHRIDEQERIVRIG